MQSTLIKQQQLLKQNLPGHFANRKQRALSRTGASKEPNMKQAARMSDGPGKLMITNTKSSRNFGLKHEVETILRLLAIIYELKIGRRYNFLI